MTRSPSSHNSLNASEKQRIGGNAYKKDLDFVVEEILRSVPKYRPRFDSPKLRLKEDNAYAVQLGQVGVVGSWILAGHQPTRKEES